MVSETLDNQSQNREEKDFVGLPSTCPIAKHCFNCGLQTVSGTGALLSATGSRGFDQTPGKE